MPYTLAHPAYALPLRVLGLPMTGLVIGSLTPDVPLWAGTVGLAGAVRATGWTYAFTHSPLGLLSACPALGLALWLAWLVARRPWLAALPAALRDRASTAVPRGGAAPARHRSAADRLRLVLGGYAALVLGAATHAGIDELTHAGRWGYRHIGWLAAEHAGLLGVKWLQYAFSALGLLVCAAAVTWWLWGPGRRLRLQARASAHTDRTGAPGGGSRASARPAGDARSGALVRLGLAAGIAGAAVEGARLLAIGPESAAMLVSTRCVVLMAVPAWCAAALAHVLGAGRARDLRRHAVRD